MTEVAFYQLARRSLDTVLPRLLDKAVAGGHRVVLRSDDPALLKRLDLLLWSYDPASFLPHAVDGADAALQPILLTAAPGAANGATLMAVVDGQLPENIGAYERVIYLFDGNDGVALSEARDHWRRLKAASHAATYWRETDAGGWEKAG